MVRSLFIGKACDQPVYRGIGYDRSVRVSRDAQLNLGQIAGLRYKQTLLCVLRAIGIIRGRIP